MRAVGSWNQTQIEVVVLAVNFILPNRMKFDTGPKISLVSQI